MDYNFLTIIDLDSFTAPQGFKRSVNIDHLLQLVSRNSSRVALLSSQSCKQLEMDYGKSDLMLVAENGAFVKTRKDWEVLIDCNDEWKPALLSAIMPLMRRKDVLEEREYIVNWKIAGLFKKSQMAFVLDKLDSLSKKFNLKISILGHELRFQPAFLCKGMAALLLRQAYGAREIMAIGKADHSGELFTALLPLSDCQTVQIGKGSSLAKLQFLKFTDFENFFMSARLNTMHSFSMDGIATFA